MVKRVEVIIFTIMFLFASMFTFGGLEETEAQVLQQESPLKIKSLSRVQAKNLYKFGKVWGFVKYYNPQVTKKNIDMDLQALEMIDVLYKIYSERDGNKKILKWVNSIGESRKSQSNYELLEGVKWIEDSKVYGRELSRKLVDIYGYERDGSNKYIRVTSDLDYQEFPEEAFENMNYEDDRMRLLGVYRFWNVAEYLYPYKYLTDQNWDDVLLTYVKEVIKGEDYNTYFETMFKLTYEVCDNHAQLYKKGEKNEFINEGKDRFIPIKFGSILNDNFHIKDIALEAEDLDIEVGDIVRRIDGENVEEMVEKLKVKLGQNNKNHITSRILFCLSKTKKESVTLEVEREGQSLTCQVPSFDKKVTFEKETASNKWIEKDILYINSGNLRPSDIEEIDEKIMEKASGVIVDLRSYPSESLIKTLGDRIVYEKKVFVKLGMPNYKKPGEFILIDKEIKPSSKKKFEGRVILLIDKTSFSHAEYTAMALRGARNVTLVGTKTNGTDGNKTSIVLPGNITAVFTGIGVYNPDGSETQRVGLDPDIEVVKTIESIREGRDLLIEKAVELIRE